LDASDDERKYRSKHVEQPRNNKLSYTVASFWSFSYNEVTYPHLEFYPAVRRQLKFSHNRSSICGHVALEMLNSSSKDFILKVLTKNCRAI
jgi:hypothetical protein